jgi:hypothetical protein
MEDKITISKCVSRRTVWRKPNEYERRGEMKHVLLLLIFLSTVVTASATMVMTVNLGDGIWVDYADSKLVIAPSDKILIGILEVPGTAPVQPQTLALGIGNGLGSLDATSMLTKTGVTGALTDNAVEAASKGVQNPFVSLEVTATITSGMLIRNLGFHCEGPGDVTMYLVDNNGEILDSQVIHQTPEPMTIALLGIGGLAMRVFRKR